VRSLPGKGSVFAIELPRAEAPEPALEAPAAIPLGGTLRGVPVLVVDDDPLVRDSIAGLLREWGCDVAAAATGAEAMTAIDAMAPAPAVILCDYRLPEEETGIEVVRRLRERLGSAVPAALVTGDTAPERLREAKESGLPLVHKPLQPARLRALLEFLVTTAPTAPQPARTASRAG
jgi:CheY-like chemotaxis protein